MASQSEGRSLPPPTGKQSDVVFMDPRGSIVVLGTAGSGKSLMAIHRAARLADPATSGSGPTLLVTYNKALVAYLRTWAGDRLHGVHVQNFSSWARATAIDTGAMEGGWTSFAQLRQRDGIIRRTLAQVGERRSTATVIDRPVRFFDDEFDWIAGMGCSDEATYQRAERVGRGGGVNRGEPRAAVWDAFATYRRLIDESSFVDDWAGVTNRAHTGLERGDYESPYRHVVIDEAQDLSPQALRALSLLVSDDGSLTLFADYAQQLYGNRLSWTQVGIPRPRIERFAENYRNSTAIAKLAIAMADQGYFKDTEDLVTPTARVAAGDKPVVLNCTGVDEFDFVVDTAKSYAVAQRVGILLPTHEDIRRYKTALGDSATEFHGSSTVWKEEPGITLTTYHSAKGIEFGTVLMPELTVDRFPDPDLVEAFGEAEARTRAARQLYVGLTRARSNLIMTHTGPLTPLLPPETDELANRLTR